MLDPITPGAEKAAPDDLFAQAMKDYKRCEEYWEDNRKAAEEDLKFRAGDQWPEKIKKARDLAGRPALVVDKINQYIRQVVNDGRQNRPGIKVRPLDAKGDEEVAEAFQGIIRHIADRSNADDAYDTALDCGVAGGFGWIRVATDYIKNDSFAQEILIKRVRNPLAVMIGPHQEADGSDSNYGFAVEDVPKSEFKDKWPKAKFINFEDNAKQYTHGWLPDDNVRVAEYFWREEVPTKMHLLESGETVSEEDYQAYLTECQTAGSQPVAIQETRTLREKVVKWARLSGAEILEENDFPGRYIPIVPVYGNEYDINGKVIYSGAIRAAKDAQRLYNFMRSAYAERVALTPKAPYVAAAGQVENYPEWETANTENVTVLKYDPIDINGTALPAPQRQNPSDIPSGFSQDMQLSEHDIQASLGMYAASVGQPSNEKSGRAILARQHEGDNATYHYNDNLNRAIRQVGRILVGIIPKIVHSALAARILGEDGSTESITLNPQQQNGTEKLGTKTIYNLNVGTYDVSVSSGPSYSTKRQEAADAMMQITQSNPQLFSVIADIMFRNFDWPGADEAAKRLKLMLPPQILQAEQQEDQQIPPEVQQAMQQVQQGQQELTQAHQQLQEQAAQVAQDKAMTEAQKVRLEALNKEIDSKDKILQANYQELSAKLELQAMKAAQLVPPVMPPGKQEPAIDPNQPPSGGFFTPPVSQP